LCGMAGAGGSCDTIMTQLLHCRCCNEGLWGRLRGVVLIS
jgi:hypothetical protein